MESFGEGIDVPGDALSFVFIDKIPDVSQELVIKLRREFYERELGNEFVDYFMAKRTRSLHQKLGRLIRTESDHGAIIIVDSRIKKWQGRTISQFLKMMEPYQVRKERLSVACDSVAKLFSST